MRRVGAGPRASRDTPAHEELKLLNKNTPETPKHIEPQEVISGFERNNATPCLSSVKPPQTPQRPLQRKSQYPSTPCGIEIGAISADKRVTELTTTFKSPCPMPPSSLTIDDNSHLTISKDTTPATSPLLRGCTSNKKLKSDICTPDYHPLLPSPTLRRSMKKEFSIEENVRRLINDSLTPGKSLAYAYKEAFKTFNSTPDKKITPLEFAKYLMEGDIYPKKREAIIKFLKLESIEKDAAMAFIQEQYADSTIELYYWRQTINMCYLAKST